MFGRIDVDREDLTWGRLQQTNVALKALSIEVQEKTRITPEWVCDRANASSWREDEEEKGWETIPFFREVFSDCMKVGGSLNPPISNDMVFVGEEQDYELVESRPYLRTPPSVCYYGEMYRLATQFEVLERTISRRSRRMLRLSLSQDARSARRLE